MSKIKNESELEEEQLPSSTDSPMLEVEDLTKIYPDGTLAVDEISFDIPQGGFTVLIGPSGCGKSTTLHSLVGKVDVTEGKVFLDGEDITTTPTYERDIGLVFQDFQLFPHMTGRKNIRYGLERMGTPESEIQSRVSELLDLMNLPDMGNRYPNELSAGQKQRVALARSLALEPKLMLLDEPLGDMDYKLQKRMERELLSLHHELDTTFVYVTHDQTQAMRLADQIIVMNQGKIEQDGSVDEVYNSPSTAFVANFVGDSNTFYGKVTESHDDGQSVSVETDLGTFSAKTTDLLSSPEDLVGRTLPFVVRPQYLRFDGGAENTLRCEVTDIIYKPGDTNQILLDPMSESTDGRTISVKSFDEPEIGVDTVEVGWDIENTILLEQTSVVNGIDLEKDILGE